MQTPSLTTALPGFAYGEEIDPSIPRSLGYRLLAPAQLRDWCSEVEAFARTLQAAPYPDSWPEVELFASILLSDGQRLIGSVRYGLTDHTPSRRRGGLEMVGVIGPHSLGVASALAIYRWLRRLRAQVSELAGFGECRSLASVLAESPPRPEAPSLLPPRLAQSGIIVFAAADAQAPDRHLALLETSAVRDWQWLPLIGPDFPLADLAARGPVIAWRPAALHAADPPTSPR